ncbi:MAG TPA: hypothetical protein PLN25_06695 [Deltaproteobacteria bacterium]|nr:hypothetical protein [Deltaproteobacteria bacterium]HQB38031.1 hypothetical protein [Deltaproteobacteria bacterium]
MRAVICGFLLLISFLFAIPSPAPASSSVSGLEQALSNALDLWREGRYEQLYDQLSNRGSVSREQFVETMRSSSTKPACCFQKISNFSVLEQKKKSATVYARIGLDSTPDRSGSVTREFKLKRHNSEWRMQMNDILKLAGTRAKKHRKKIVRRH